MFELEQGVHCHPLQLAAVAHGTLHTPAMMMARPPRAADKFLKKCSTAARSYTTLQHSK